MDDKKNENAGLAQTILTGHSDVPPPPPVISNTTSEREQVPVEPVLPQSTRNVYQVEEVASDQTVPEILHNPASPAVPPPPATLPPSPRPKLPAKVLLLGLGVVLLVGVLGFIAKQVLFQEPPVPQVTNLTFWGLEEEAVVTPLITQYESSHPNVRVKYLKQAKQDYRERLTNSLAKGEGPDMFWYHNTWVPMLSGSLGAVPPEVIEPSSYQNAFYPSAVNDLRRGVDFVGIPLMFDGLGLYVNIEMFQNANKIVPTTWDELRQTAKDLTLKDETGRILQAGVALGRTSNVDHWQDIIGLMLLQSKVDLSNPSGEDAQNTLKYFIVFSTQDKDWDDTLPASTQAFASGKLAMYFGPSWRAYDIKQLSPSLNFKVVPVPQLPKNTPTAPDVNWASYWAGGVWGKSKNLRQAWEFMKFLSEKESLQAMYTNASKTRLTGFPYPRSDMADLIASDPYIGAFAQEAPTAKSWYLASQTYDGPTGINSRVSKLFEDAMNQITNENKDAKDVLATVASGLNQVLSSYGK